MSATTEPRPTAGSPGPVGTPQVTTAATHARRAWVLLGLGAFQVWLWAPRLWNLANDPTPRSTGFVVVHAVLYLAAFGAAGVLLALGWRMRREARAATRGRTAR